MSEEGQQRTSEFFQAFKTLQQTKKLRWKQNGRRIWRRSAQVCFFEVDGAEGVAVRKWGWIDHLLSAIGKGNKDETLVFTRPEWDAFVAGAKEGEFNL